jgi:hypothetical protein
VVLAWPNRCCLISCSMLLQLVSASPSPKVTRLVRGKIRP